MRRIVIAGLAALSFGAAAPAAGENRAERAPPGPFSGLVQERDVALLFDYLREAVSAAVDGREPPRADRLIERAEAIGEDAKRRAAAAARAVLDAIESSVREGLREPRRAPPSSPSQGL